MSVIIHHISQGPDYADEQNTPASGQASEADKSALGAINDSVGKFGIDQLNRAIDDGKRCVEQAEQAKAFPGHGVSCQGTQRICLYCAQKLVLHYWLVPLSFCPVVRTKFPNRVINRPLRLVACQQIIHTHFLWCGLVKGFRVVYYGASSSFEALSGCLYYDWRSCSCQDFVTALALGIPNQCTTCFGLLACSFRECRAGLFKL